MHTVVAALSSIYCYNLSAVLISTLCTIHDTAIVTSIQGVCVSTATQPSGDEAAVYHKVYNTTITIDIINCVLLPRLHSYSEASITCGHLNCTTQLDMQR
jgi:hypothetical protein